MPLPPPVYSIEVTDSLGNGKAAIHIIDDFINIGTTFFPPDPGSIMDRLLTDEASTISSRIRYTRWYRELGNSEREWTVFVPLYSVNSYDIEPYIVAGTVNDPIIGEAGAFTSVDGSSHVIENVDGALTIDDIDISEINALQVNDGHVHRIAWPIGADYLSVFETVLNSVNHTYLTMLINRANLAYILDDPYGEYTIFAPNDAAFAALGSATLESMYGDDLVRFLQYHIVEGTYDLAELISVFPADATLESLVVDEFLTFTYTEMGPIAVNDVAIIGDLEATAGIVHSIGTVLTPPEAAIDPVVNTSTGTGAAALIGSGTAYSEAGAAIIATFPSSLDNTNDNADVFMFFVPSNAAMAAIPLTGAELTLPNVQRHIETTVTALVDGGTITTVGEEGSSHAVAADADVEGGFTVGSFPVTLLGTTPEGGEIYGIEGVLP